MSQIEQNQITGFMVAGHIPVDGKPIAKCIPVLAETAQTAIRDVEEQFPGIQISGVMSEKQMSDMLKQFSELRAQQPA